MQFPHSDVYATMPEIFTQIPAKVAGSIASFTTTDAIGAINIQRHLEILIASYNSGWLRTIINSVFSATRGALGVAWYYRATFHYILIHRVVRQSVSAYNWYCQYISRLWHSYITHHFTVEDPNRCLPKLHITMTHEDNVPIRVAARHKADAFLVTDEHTPIISNWCRYIRRQYPEITDAEYSKFRSFIRNDGPFHGKFGPWPQPKTELEHGLIKDTFCQLIKTTPELVDQIAHEMDTIDDYNAWTKLPWHTVVKLPCVVGGEIRLPRD